MSGFYNKMRAQLEVIKGECEHWLWVGLLHGLIVWEEKK